MNIYDIPEIGALIKGNSYVGRGIVIGKSADRRSAVCAYFIMGRSENSRNRVFCERGGDIYTQPFDASKVSDPSLIIYPAVKSLANRLIVTNGDQTETVYNACRTGVDFRDALACRAFEPDKPNFTPRISGMLTFDGGDFVYSMSILKSMDSEGSACARYTFDYTALRGLGHFIHTYIGDGNPLPTFTGEPERVFIPSDIGEFTDSIWDSLDSENKISLYVRYTDLETGGITSRLVNKNR